jgi:hypothetical protein
MHPIILSNRLPWYHQLLTWPPFHCNNLPNVSGIWTSLTYIIYSPWIQRLTLSPPLWMPKKAILPSLSCLWMRPTSGNCCITQVWLHLLYSPVTLRTPWTLNPTGGPRNFTISQVAGGFVTTNTLCMWQRTALTSTMANFPRPLARSQRFKKRLEGSQSINSLQVWCMPRWIENS